ncbi:MAG: carboxypeptidase-like regulatory domain-containing protein [Candidatus Brocadiaceae bacterium]|nr:carboxypeptidase-like regulatory domain-containing protein [Candidatus Brocadiaceae bacterium]
MFKKVFAGFLGIALVAGIGMAKAQAYQVKPAKLWVTAIAIGTPIEGAEIKVGDNTCTTGKNGTCVFELRPGSYEITVHEHGGASAHTEISLQERDIRFISLDLGAKALHPSGHH